MILKKLREETAQFHLLAEQLNFSNELANNSITTEDYGILLKRLYLFFFQLSMLEAFNNRNFFHDYFFSEKVHLLSLDISNVGNGFMNNQHLFKNVSYLEYLGFCYVAVGSMLGGNFIFNNLNINEQSSNRKFPKRFYESCGESVERYWKLFTAFLQNTSPSEHDGIINGAKIAYLYFIYLCTTIK